MCRLDMQAYDMSNRSLRQQGYTYLYVGFLSCVLLGILISFFLFSLEVPGLAENRPSVVLGMQPVCSRRLHLTST
jgi:hypothetical protein